MGRPPSNGSPAFRFTQAEVAEMESILYHHNLGVPSRNYLEEIATKFSNLPDRKGKIVVQAKQIWNWFQNRRYALRSKSNRISTSTKPNDIAVVRQDSTPGKNAPHNAPTHVPVASTPAASLNSGRSTDNYILEFEAKSSRDGAWYDVGNFLSCRNMESDPEVLVRFSGFGKEEDEWADPRNHIRLRSLPCESTECVAILPGDLILCFQEGKDQALYFDAHVLDAQRRRHDVRGCRCRFLVRYDHDHSEEIVPLKKMCRRPEADYRLRQMVTAVDGDDGKEKTVVVPVGWDSETSERKQEQHEQQQQQQQQKEEGGEDDKCDVVLALPLPAADVAICGEEEKDLQPVNMLSPSLHNATAPDVVQGTSA